MPKLKAPTLQDLAILAFLVDCIYYEGKLMFAFLQCVDALYSWWFF